MRKAEEESPAWYAMPADRVLALLESLPSGLTASAAKDRFRRFGPNHIAKTRREGPLRILLRQFASPLVYILGLSATAAILLGKATDGAVILAVVFVNTLVGFIQELQAGKAIESLSAMMPVNVTLLRDGGPVPASAHEIVPGDIVLLQAGDQVPADLRLLAAENLATEESALTGESLPVGKHVHPAPEAADVGDRTSMVFGGTLVVSGTGKAVAVATGSRTELGRISEMLGEITSLETPLTRRLARLAVWITAAVLAVAALILGVGLLREYPLVDSLLAAITLAVAAVPEGLPAAITIASAIGVRRMATKRAIIRHLPAVETLGGTTVICTDKTGTLTRNEMTVQAMWTPRGNYETTGTGYTPEGGFASGGTRVAELPREAIDLLLSSLLCNDANLAYVDGRWRITGDPTEAALLVAARKAGMDDESLREASPRLDTIQFDSDRRFMATLHGFKDGSRLICLKGAPEAVMGFCPTFSDGSPFDGKRMHAAVNDLASQGLRVLAIASGEAPASVARLSGGAPGVPLRFLGVVGMIDSLRPEAVSAVKACREAGIVVKIITGDHPSTAEAIGRQLGLLEGNAGPAVTGKMISGMADAELEAAAQTANVFARVSPEHKLRLVKVLQARGEIVAMTGDGVNDAPALKQANIGVAMGIGGTAVAREAADMVLADDNFASIQAAVEEGRRVFDNLTKSLAFILPTSFGQAMIILVAVLFFPVHGGHLLMPIDPAQILWVNLVVAVTLALPLAFEAPEPDLMRRPPRPPDAPLLSGLLVLRTFLVAALMTGAAIGLFFYEYLADLRMGIDPARALAESQTVTVTTIILFQAAYLLNCRSLTDTVFRIGLFTNMHVYYGILAVLALQLCLVYAPPLNRIFHTYPLSASDWLAPTLVALACLPVVALERRLWRRGRGVGPK